MSKDTSVYLVLDLINDLVDPDGHVAIDYGVAGVPETFFVDPTGRIVHKQVGPLTWPAMQTLLGRVRGGS